MTDKQPEALRLAELLELAPEDGIEPQTAEDAAAELRRQHTRIAELESQLEAIGAGGVAPLIGQQTRDSFTAADMATAAEEGYRDGAAELRRQHARIAELEARIKTMAEEHADELMVAHMDGRMRAAQPEGAQQPGAVYAVLPTMFREALAWGMTYGPEIPAHQWDEMRESMVKQYTERASHGQAPAGLAVPSMSADEVNALPTAARAYIHQLETNTDPAGMVRENMQLRDTNAGLQSMYRKAADAAQEVIGCFHAAECEGLQAALAGTADEHLKDLVERRLMYALYAAQEVAGQTPAQAAPVCGSPADLPPLPDPDLRDVGTKPEDIKNFLRGYATEYAKAALASSAPADSVLEDAARYRWLRDVGDPTWVPFRIRTGYSAAQVDDAIDAARKQGANHD